MKPCYVCLEDTFDESPCACGAPLHASCYEAMQRHMPGETCSICGSEFTDLHRRMVRCIFVCAVFMIVMFVSVCIWGATKILIFYF